ncbi:hypothetical protein [uncultured Parvimonas sp.]|uniref:hypothetical protein n=1 Tax=uncultured Parvimonas sp. TaxID=747372 RepID=UPI002594C3E8|nr:hypothetical protein [uncultured Parvimonas sp.]
MKKGLSLSLKLLFKTFLMGILVSVLFELVFLKFTKFLNIDVNFDVEIFWVILVASFLTYIFSKKNIVNHLFINGCSRKRISTIRILSCIIYDVLFFLLFILYEIFYGDLISNITDISTIINLAVVYFSINFVSEISTFLNLIYKSISIKKGKGINKTFYRYIYSFAFIALAYSYRFIYPNIQKYYNDIVAIVVLVVVFVLQVFLAYINKRIILKVDIRA